MICGWSPPCEQGGTLSEPNPTEYDAFISYAHADAAWVRVLADNLERLGVRVWLDAYEIRSGDVLVRELERGIRASLTGVVVFSRASVTRPWVQEEYDAIVTRAAAAKQRLLPILREEIELPPFAASRVWMDFRNVDGPQYFELVAELARALKGEKARPRPQHGEPLQPIPGTAFRPEGPVELTLRISQARVTLVGAERLVRAKDAGSGEHLSAPEIEQRPQGWHASDADRLRELERARIRAPGSVEHQLRNGSTSASPSSLHQHLLDAGRRLGQAFLAGPVAVALGNALAQADSLNATLRLGLEIDAPLHNLPWETLCVPEGAEREPSKPLVLLRCVELYRRLPAESTPAQVIPGPLRILVAIGSPEAQSESGELLDVESELGRILDGTDAARANGGAYVRILRRGSLKAIRNALQQERFHILHVSCHADPAGLVLEDEDGREDAVDAERFVNEVLQPDRGVPLVVLAGCSTAQAVVENSTGSSDLLPGIGMALLQRGVPSVVAMTAPVTDRYAIRWARLFYRELSSDGGDPLPVRALSNVRRALESARRSEPEGSAMSHLAEWATPTLLLRGPALRLYDPKAARADLRASKVPQLPGVVVRQTGEFVGRRRDGRLALAALAGKRSGVVLQGLGGVGKSSLSGQLATDLAERGFLVASVTGPIAVDDVLRAIGARLRAEAISIGGAEDHPLRQLSAEIGRASLDWRERLSLLRDSLLSERPVLLLLDNFEDNLTAGNPREVRDAELGAFLADWLKTPARGRLLFTCRYPFVLPTAAEGHIEHLHLGPLSFAEIRQLIWRLPGVDRLPTVDQQRAYHNIGGHPRTLEYLDTLLQGGTARFDDIRVRIDAQLKASGVPNPAAWLGNTPFDIDHALAEAVTLAADDVMLDELLAQAADTLEAVELAHSAAVYRIPVDECGLRFVVSEAKAADPELEAIGKQVDAELGALRGADGALPSENLWPEALRKRVTEVRAWLAVPPIEECAEFEAALRRVEQLGLIAPVTAGDDGGRFTMHRWTADHLLDKASDKLRRVAHERAARYFRWRVRGLALTPEQRVEERLEARYHFHAAGLVSEALIANDEACHQLETWGAYGLVEQLHRQLLSWVEPSSAAASVSLHQLGNIAYLRSDFDAAREFYLASVNIKHRVGDRAGTALSLHQLGMVARGEGDYEVARQHYRCSLEISEEVGNQLAWASSYHELGILAELRGEYDVALKHFRCSLDHRVRLGDRAGLAQSYHQIGAIADRRGDYEVATENYHLSLEIKEQLGDRAGSANTYHQLGNVACRRGDYDGAQDYYRVSLDIREELGDRVGVASSYHQLGMVAQFRGDIDTAVRHYHRSLEVREQVGNRASVAESYHQLGVVAQLRLDDAGARQYYQQSLDIKERLGDRAGMALINGLLGVLARQSGELEEAHRRHQHSLDVQEQIGDRPGMAASYHQLGIVAQLREDYDLAFDYLQRSRNISDELGLRVEVANSCDQLGAAYTQAGRPREGLGWTVRGFLLHAELQLPAARIGAHWLGQQRELLGDPAFFDALLEGVDDATANAILGMLDALADADEQTA